ncbi:DUF4129 domain-containing protein [Candidatus Sumerlaeota bacterium]|nr:DUF4129 domain-containing protein [Candidatus Sumerlaeota bacterium]
MRAGDRHASGSSGPITGLPSPVPLIASWALPTLLSVTVAVWALWPVRSAAVGSAIAFALATALCLLIPVVARGVVMDLTGQLDYQLKFWLMMAHIGIFTLPLVGFGFMSETAPWPIGCAMLCLPLSAGLVFPRSCHYLLANLIALWWGVVAMRPGISPVFPLTAIALMMLACGVTHIHFRHMRFRRTAPPHGQALGGAALTLLAAMPIALALWWLLPSALFERAHTVAEEVVRDIAPRPMGRGDIVRLLFETTFVVALGIGLIVATGLIMKRLRSQGRPVAVEFLDEGEEGALFDLPAPPRRARRRGGTLRERVIASYLNAVERMQSRGWAFPTSMTAREFRTEANTRVFAGRDPLGELTALFERAKYSDAEIDESEADRAHRAARGVARATGRGGA